MWFCPHNPPGNDQPYSKVEEALGVPYVEKREPNPFRAKIPISKRLLRALVEESTKQGHVLIATDGSSIGTDFHTRVATFGVAIQGFVYSDNVRGMDQTSSVAELEALIFVLEHLAVCGKDAVIIIDNLTVVRNYRKTTTGHYHGKYLNGAWSHVAQLRSKCKNLQAHWVPSHGKKDDWTAPPGHDTQVWRKLNHQADVAANTAATDLHTRQAVYRKNIDLANDRALRTLRRLKQGVAKLGQTNPSRNDIAVSRKRGREHETTEATTVFKRHDTGPPAPVATPTAPTTVSKRLVSSPSTPPQNKRTCQAFAIHTPDQPGPNGDALLAPVPALPAYKRPNADTNGAQPKRAKQERTLRKRIWPGAFITAKKTRPTIPRGGCLSVATTPSTDHDSDRGPAQQSLIGRCDDTPGRPGEEQGELFHSNNRSLLGRACLFLAVTHVTIIGLLCPADRQRLHEPVQTDPESNYRDGIAFSVKDLSYFSQPQHSVSHERVASTATMRTLTEPLAYGLSLYCKTPIRENPKGQCAIFYLPQSDERCHGAATSIVATMSRFDSRQRHTSPLCFSTVGIWAQRTTENGECTHFPAEKEAFEAPTSLTPPNQTSFCILYRKGCSGNPPREKIEPQCLWTLLPWKLLNDPRLHAKTEPRTRNCMPCQSAQRKRRGIRKINGFSKRNLSPSLKGRKRNGPKIRPHRCCARSKICSLSVAPCEIRDNAENRSALKNAAQEPDPGSLHSFDLCPTGARKGGQLRTYLAANLRNLSPRAPQRGCGYTILMCAPCAAAPSPNRFFAVRLLPLLLCSHPSHLGCFDVRARHFFGVVSTYGYYSWQVVHRSDCVRAFVYLRPFRQWCARFCSEPNISIAVIIVFDGGLRFFPPRYDLHCGFDDFLACFQPISLRLGCEVVSNRPVRLYVNRCCCGSLIAISIAVTDLRLDSNYFFPHVFVDSTNSKVCRVNPTYHGQARLACIRICPRIPTQRQRAPTLAPRAFQAQRETEGLWNRQGSGPTRICIEKVKSDTRNPQSYSGQHRRPKPEGHRDLGSVDAGRGARRRNSSSEPPGEHSCPNLEEDRPQGLAQGVYQIKYPNRWRCICGSSTCTAIKDKACVYPATHLQAIIANQDGFQIPQRSVQRPLQTNESAQTRSKECRGPQRKAQTMPRFGKRKRGGRTFTAPEDGRSPTIVRRSGRRRLGASPQCAQTGRPLRYGFLFRAQPKAMCDPPQTMVRSQLPTVAAMPQSQEMRWFSRRTTWTPNQSLQEARPTKRQRSERIPLTEKSGPNFMAGHSTPSPTAEAPATGNDKTKCLPITTSATQEQVEAQPFMRRIIRRVAKIQTGGCANRDQGGAGSCRGCSPSNLLDQGTASWIPRIVFPNIGTEAQYCLRQPRNKPQPSPSADGSGQRWAGSDKPMPAGGERRRRPTHHSAMQLPNLQSLCCFHGHLPCWGRATPNTPVSCPPRDSSSVCSWRLDQPTWMLTVRNEAGLLPNISTGAGGCISLSMGLQPNLRTAFFKSHVRPKPQYFGVCAKKRIHFVLNLCGASFSKLDVNMFHTQCSCSGFCSDGINQLCLAASLSNHDVTKQHPRSELPSYRRSKGKSSADPIHRTKRRFRRLDESAGHAPKRWRRTMPQEGDPTSNQPRCWKYPVAGPDAAASCCPANQDAPASRRIPSYKNEPSKDRWPNLQVGPPAPRCDYQPTPYGSNTEGQRHDGLGNPSKPLQSSPLAGRPNTCFKQEHRRLQLGRVFRQSRAEKPNSCSGICSGAAQVGSHLPRSRRRTRPNRSNKGDHNPRQRFNTCRPLSEPNEHRRIRRGDPASNRRQTGNLSQSTRKRRRLNTKAPNQRRRLRSTGSIQIGSLSRKILALLLITGWCSTT